MTSLFEPFRLRDLEFRNRVFMAPMCQYAAHDGNPGEWHLVHYGARAVGGAGMVMLEASAVTPAGRITPGDLGIWADEHIPGFAKLARFIRSQGSVAAIQLAHAGRKASCAKPMDGGKPLPSRQGGWDVVAASAIPFDQGYPIPQELDEAALGDLRQAFANAARRCLEAGFQVAEVHMAHGYLLHSFLSPLANRRTDAYGGSFENRIRFPLEVASEVRRVWPEELPVLVRISCTDWVEGGWDLPQSIRFSELLKQHGIDLIDCSSGGLTPDTPMRPDQQTSFAGIIRREAGIATGAVGAITEPNQAQAIVAEEIADAVFLGRELLRNPYWPLHAARALNAAIEWPPAYLRARI
jgi:2,4-dienoyl-CoA reductase-like NADH-dependent reductase (Old Yellow Enzyme family)